MPNTYTLSEIADALRCDVLWLQLSLNAVGGSYSKAVRCPGERVTRELLIRFIAARPEGREARLLAALLRRDNQAKVRL